MADIAVGFTVSGQREKYLRQALNSWARVRGVDDAHLVFCIEPQRSFPLKEFSWWASQQFHSVSFVVNHHQLGCLKNTRQAFDSCFESGAQFAVMAEEDLEVATDALEYFRWASEAYRDEQGLVMVCGHCKGSGRPDPAAVTRASWFSPLLCGTWKDRWESYVKPGWKGWAPGQYDDAARSQAWDTNLRWQIRGDGLNSLFPARSRSLHVGEFSTWLTPTVAEFLFEDTQSNVFFPDNPPQTYREVPWDDIPGLLV